MQYLNRLKKYISEEENWIFKIQKMLWISKWCVYNLIRQRYKKINPNLLKKIYIFFDLNYDEFFFENLANRYTKDKRTLFWKFIFLKRIEKWLTMQEYQNKTRIWLKTLYRIEHKKNNFNKESLDIIFNVLKLNNIEREIAYWIYDIETIQSKYTLF